MAAAEGTIGALGRWKGSGENPSHNKRCLMNVFREDVAALVPHLRAFARSLTGGDVHFADDIVQDTIVNALQAQHQFTPGTNLKAWLFTILRNRFRSVIARKHVTAEVADDDLERHYWVGAEQESRIEVAAFKRAFRLLSSAHREVLVLVAIHGLPYDEIAEICNCEVGTVKSRVNRARAILKRMLLDDPVPVDARKLPAADRASQIPEADDLAEDLLRAAGNPKVRALARARSAAH
jgi:RNA polymerase sigma-70 factor, ECF subfamily